ncbi:MAG: ABC transporter permease [Planctomycetota bacterium]
MASAEFLAHQSVSLATPIVLAALGETIVECAGVMNLGIEGAMLTGAFFGVLGSYYSGSAEVGLCVGIAAALVFQLIFAWATLYIRANEIIAGTAANLLAFGSTAVLWRATLGLHGDRTQVARFPEIHVPIVSEIPFIGNLLFQHHIITYLTFISIAAVWLLLEKTSFGMRLRACGESPASAAAFGIHVVRTRFIAILLCGVFAGTAGAALSLAEAGTFVDGMSSGRGFVAIALVLFGGHRVLRISAFSLLFGAALAFQFGLQASGNSEIPPEFFRSLPYVLSLIVLAVVMERRRVPASLGRGLPQ